MAGCAAAKRQQLLGSEQTRHLPHPTDAKHAGKSWFGTENDKGGLDWNVRPCGPVSLLRHQYLVDYHNYAVTGSRHRSRCLPCAPRRPSRRVVQSVFGERECFVIYRLPALPPLSLIALSSFRKS
jgi:hypothetical protein